MDARLALRTSEERARALHGRADALVRAAQAEREARARAVERRERLVREGRAAQAVGRRRGRRAGQARALDPAWPTRPAPRSRRRGPSVSRSCWRSGRPLRELAREHDELVNSVHRDEMARTQQRMRMEQLTERALEELGLDEDVTGHRVRPRPAGAP